MLAKGTLRSLLVSNRDRSLAEKAYMEYIEKIYSICCHLNENPQGYDTDVIPLVCYNRQIDMGRTIHNVKSLCKHYHIEEHRAQQIVHLILWRLERMSRLLSGCLRHDPREESKRDMQYEFKLNLDGAFRSIDRHQPCEELPGKQTRRVLDDEVSELWGAPF